MTNFSLRDVLYELAMQAVMDADEPGVLAAATQAAIASGAPPHAVEEVLRAARRRCTTHLTARDALRIANAVLPP
ncbi:MAG TPA: hypothetical protein PLN91_00570 [Rhodanobacteraceae bacterium]|nr:hypothetical protein [Rhodanobacteraceae bacterium]